MTDTEAEEIKARQIEAERTGCHLAVACLAAASEEREEAITNAVVQLTVMTYVSGGECARIATVALMRLLLIAVGRPPLTDAEAQNMLDHVDLGLLDRQLMEEKDNGND
jgi:hypothetical protein